MRVGGSTFMQGISMAVLAGVCWGAMGVAVEKLFINHSGIGPEELVTIRLLVAGILFLFWAGSETWTVVRDRQNWPVLIMCGLYVYLGQFCFMKAITYTNAGTAAILLTTVPFWVAFWFAMIERKWPHPPEILCFFMVVIGVGLIMTKGDLSTLNFNLMGLAWAMLSALTTAAYSIHPRALLARASTKAIMGWVMIIGGCMASVVTPPWEITMQITATNMGLLFFICVVGTLVAFACYAKALHLISPVIVGLLICFEPLTAYLFGVLFLNLQLTWLECTGIATVLTGVTIVTLAGKKCAA